MEIVIMKNIIQIEPWINDLELDELKRVISSTFVTESKLNTEFENYIVSSKTNENIFEIQKKIFEFL